MKDQTTKRRSFRTRRIRLRVFFLLCIGTVLIGHLTAVTAEDQPTITLSHHNLYPAIIEVHVGEIVTWRSVTGDRFELRFDLHPSAHEVITQADEVKGFFRRTGEHTYSGRLRDGRSFSGMVRVRERDGTMEPPFTDQCDPSRTLCLMP